MKIDIWSLAIVFLQIWSVLREMLLGLLMIRFFVDYVDIVECLRAIYVTPTTVDYSFVPEAHNKLKEKYFRVC